jgi:hypothetical protein
MIAAVFRGPGELEVGVGSIASCSVRADTGARPELPGHRSHLPRLGLLGGGGAKGRRTRPRGGSGRPQGEPHQYTTGPSEIGILDECVEELFAPGGF